ncbi:MAG: UDP-N-acetylmuramate dehydrogenase [Rhizobacter sp.]|nr:UDP-N-acetylmuramate dehydrogenase [Chlorobiales bacterium]
MITVEELRQSVRGEILLGENLAKYTSLKIGGNADFFIRPLDKTDVLAAVQFFHERRQPYLVLGRGSNVLVSDDGIRGAVITLRDNLDRVEINGNKVVAQAGADLPALAVKLLRQGLGGLENLSGIPGSIGGAIVMNAGAYGREIFEVIRWVEVIRDGKLIRLQREDINYHYRGTDLHHDIILAAEFQLHILNADEQAAASQRRKDFLAKRQSSQPLNWPNAGSIFKNPPPDEAGVLRFTGSLIEACGLKGVQHGGAQISEKHANFIINSGDAKASDVIALIELCRSEVRKKFGIELELEVKLIGFQNAASSV